MRLKSNSALATRRFAARFGRKITTLKSSSGRALVVGLTGDLGAGKTTFVQGLAKSLGIKKRILSPTFLIMRNYKIGAGGFTRLFHVDAYRLRKEAELTPLYFKTVLNNPRHLILVEWSERIKNLLPRRSFWLRFSHGRKPNERFIEIKNENLSHY